jgi:NRPS condensation-like uncharacterized protein
MAQNNTLIRPLNNIEQAFTISNEAIPLVVVCTLHLASGPSVEALKMALQKLQSRHPLLQAGVFNVKGQLYFQKLQPVPPVELTVVTRKDANTWKTTSEHALNARFDKAGPLLKCWYLPDDENSNCELIICLHHSIIDGISARLILHEILSLSGGVALPAPLGVYEGSKFPDIYRKWGLIKRLFPIMGRQMMEEWRYKKQGMVSSIPESSENGTLHFKLTPELSRKLILKIGREGQSLNSVLLATITKVILRHKYPERQKGLTRVISFVDLRQSVIPPMSDQALGCYVSMLRFSIPTHSEQSVFQMAGNIRNSIFKAARRGEVFVMAQISKYLIRMIFKLKNVRLGVSALSFIGKLDLEKQYGSIQLKNVTAFITNNRFGADFSAFGKILFGSIGLDFTYLKEEFSGEQAEKIVSEIKEVLIKIANEFEGK